MSKYVCAIVIVVLIPLFGISQIPNPDFENWNSSGSYEEPNGWGTINPLTAPASIFTATKSTDVHSGTYALRLESKSIFFQKAPGIAGTGTVNQSTQDIEGGFQLSQPPCHLKGWYKYSPASGDEGSVSIEIWRWNNTTMQRDVLGSGQATFTTSVGTYTQFNLPITYQSQAMPDSARIIILTSDPSDIQVGSVLFVDDLSFDFMSANLSSVDATCGQPDGTATVDSVINGTAPYNYLWDNGDTTTTATGLAAGNHSVTLVDAMGCSTVESVNVNDAGGVTATVSQTNVSCNGGSDGEATVLPTGGTPPYTITWTTGDTTLTVINLVAGSYNVTVSDVNNCQTTQAIIITQPTPVSGTVNGIIDVTCAGSLDGSIGVLVTGGTPAYSFSWSNGATTQGLFNIGADTYSVTVTDDNGCTATVSATVAEPDSLIATATATDETSASANDGSVTVTTSGGAGFEMYEWDDPSSSNTATVNSLDAGIYMVTVTDGNGCTTTASATVGTSIGIKEHGNLGIEIFPNPAKNVISISSLFVNQALQLHIYDVSGKAVLSANTTSVDVSTLRAGLYLLKLKTSKGETARAKLLIAD